MALVRHNTPRVMYSYNYLTNASSSNMIVNGSVTPVTFSYTPAQDECLVALAIYLRDGGTMDYTDFGSAAGLTNGLLVRAVSVGTTYDLMTIKTNEDLFLLTGSSTGGSTGGLLGIGGTAGFLNDNDNAIGIIGFSPYPISLFNANSDSISILVRDNLSGAGIDKLTAVAVTYRFI